MPIAPIDGAVQKVFPTSLRTLLLNQWNYLTLVEHPGERRYARHVEKEVLLGAYGL